MAYGEDTVKLLTRRLLDLYPYANFNFAGLSAALTAVTLDPNAAPMLKSGTHPLGMRAGASAGLQVLDGEAGPTYSILGRGRG